MTSSSGQTTTTTTTTTTTILLCLAETVAFQTIDTIQEFINVLRREFPIIMMMSNSTVIKEQTFITATNHHNRNNNQNYAVDVVVPLYAIMVKEGILTRILSIDNQRKEPQSTKGIKDDDDDDTHEISTLTTQERDRLIFDMVLPLLRSLSWSYQILDSISHPLPLTSTMESSKPNDHNNNNNKKQQQQHQHSSSTKQKQSPPPPKGMLSIQQYTDVACLLEFLVCTAIIPFLEPYILKPIKDRIRYELPKSLAGRIPSASLLWSQLLLQQQQEEETNDGTNHNNAEMLYDVAKAISDIVLLDRFRPMLLPRHLPDIYAALFQAERDMTKGSQTLSSQQQQKYEGVKKEMKRNQLLYQILGLLSSSTTTNKTNNNPPSSTTTTLPVVSSVDVMLQVKAYQTLLLQGTQSPLWLRQRVSPLLTDLACHHLDAIVTVFVPLSEESTTRMSVSARRLGEALVVSNSSSIHQERLCHQMLNLLTAVFPVVRNNNNHTTNASNETNDGIPPRSMAIIQTAWAMLDHLPIYAVDRYILQTWAQRLLLMGSEFDVHHTFQDNTVTTEESTNLHHATIRQIGSLCMYLPPYLVHSAAASSKFLIMRLVLDQKQNNVILASLIRVACNKSLQVLFSNATRRDAEQTLQWLFYDAVLVANETTSTTSNHQDVVLKTWVNALAPSPWDFHHAQHELVRKSGEDGNILESLTIPTTQMRRRTSDDIDLNVIVSDTHTRCKFFVHQVLLRIVSPSSNDRLAPNDVTTGTTTGSAINNGFPSRVFRYLLREFLFSEEETSPSYRLTITSLLPVVCEFYSHNQEQLLFGEKENALGLLELIGDVLRKVGSLLSGSNKQNRSGDNNVSTQHQNDPLFAIMQMLDENQFETLLSVASIVMSLLIALLEYGSKQRSEEEEHMVQSFLPMLTNLAELHERSTISSEIIMGVAIADMASYAMPLIASRSVNYKKNDTPSPQRNDECNIPSFHQKLHQVLQEAEEDLKSSQPPIRARGMVALGRIARGFSGALPMERTPPLVVQEILNDDSGHVVSSHTNDLLLLIIHNKKTLRLALMALLDSESYVYMAAIQTIVAICDLDPKTIVPLIAKGVVRGEVQFLIESSGGDDDDDQTPNRVGLSREQRLKLGEALVFSIRRRAAVNEYIPALLRVLLGRDSEYGPISVQSEKASESDQELIRKGTIDYFLGPEDDPGEPGTNKERWEEQDIRLRTGGPVFEIEEEDATRSIRISIVAELVSVSSPSMMAPVCNSLLLLAVVSLRLDCSRLVKRAAAFLARELYDCLFREAEDLASHLMDATCNSDFKHATTIPFAVAMLTSKEDKLNSALLDYVRGNTPECHVQDETTLVRCQEAMKMRAYALEQGVFAAAQLLIDDQNALARIPKMLRLSNASGIGFGSHHGPIN